MQLLDFQLWAQRGMIPRPSDYEAGMDKKVKTALLAELKTLAELLAKHKKTSK